LALTSARDVTERRRRTGFAGRRGERRWTVVRQYADHPRTKKDRVAKARRRNEVARLEAEIEAARPFLDVAREIHEDITRIAADPSAPADRIAEVIDAIPARERRAVARAVFDRLTPEQQWAVIAEVFGDEEIRTALADERDARLEELRRNGARQRLASIARSEHRVDMAQIPEHDLVGLGLFRETDVRAAIGRGPTSTSCARRVVLRRGREPGTFYVVEDVFNPAGGYFVTGAYDAAAWQAERLATHAPVRVGTISSSGRARSFEPVLYVGARADFEVAGQLVEGRLHLGYVTLEDLDLLGQGGQPQ
jgi:hypothetical protein